jgi:hypothetical protein
MRSLFPFKMSWKKFENHAAHDNRTDKSEPKHRADVDEGAYIVASSY